MAIMLPSEPYGFDPKSREDDMFYGLQGLPDDYYVFYSLKTVSFSHNTLSEREADFVIYNRKKGIMVIEAKAGRVWCDHGIWRYGNGKEMRNPFKQADDGRWRFRNLLYASSVDKRDPITKRCEFHFAVWFPSLTKKDLNNITWPIDADPAIVMTAEDLDNPKKAIERIFDINFEGNDGVTNLSKEDHRFLMDGFFCPYFNILPSKSYELDNKRKRFDAMIAEQVNILNYLEYQRTAVINGAAGTGKTMIAVEKARRHSQNGESVLFLCFNSKLKEHLEKAYPYENVSYYTIDGFASKMCLESMPDFGKLEYRLLEYTYDVKAFPYMHIIVDEGQDFGQERMHMDSIFGLLEDIILKKSDVGTFYIFYDKLQMVQSAQIPAYIENADCRLTLYKNCRNTQKIAETSARPLRLSTPVKMKDSVIPGDKPVIAFCNSSKEAKTVLDKIIRKSKEDAMDDIQIVSCAAAGNSIFREYVSRDKYKLSNMTVPFATARKFKGLEAEHVILVDVNKELLDDESMLFYVGSSRAKLQLSVIAVMNEDDCTEVVKAFGSVVKKRDPKETLAKLLACKQFE